MRAISSKGKNGPSMLFPKKSAAISLFKDHLHWRTLCDNARNNAGDSDTYCTCLGHLRCMMTKVSNYSMISHTMTPTISC